MSLVFPVEDQSRIAEIRRAADRIARDEGLSEILTANVSLVATEICTNLLKHARESEVFLSALSDHSTPGVEILAIDRGPGMRDVAGCLVDGYSSTDTAGTGFGAIIRRSAEFDLYSEPGKGTVLVARVGEPRRSPTFAGAVVKPIRGEEVSGDAWAIVEQDGRVTMIVADGLGHGIMAARASSEAISAFRRSLGDSPRDMLAKVHGSMRSTRGAAVAIASVDQRSSLVRYAGVGNINGVLIGATKPTLMISHNGTAGYHSPKLQEFSYPLPENSLLVMHSDGLQTSWNLDDYPGLRRRDPSVIAGVLYRDWARNRDDACVSVATIGLVS